jgi:hypothetical protein
MLIVQMVMALILALSAGEAPMVASLGANPVSIGEEQADYQRPPKREEPQIDITLSELKAMYN